MKATGGLAAHNRAAVDVLTNVTVPSLGWLFTVHGRAGALKYR